MSATPSRDRGQDDTVWLRLEQVGRRYRRHGAHTGRWRGGSEPNPVVEAVDDVTLDVRRGETLGIVGGSGSGKSTLARLMLLLEPPDRGRIIIDGRDSADLDPRSVRALRGRMQMVFQGTLGAFNPRHRARRVLTEPLALHRQLRGDELERQIVRLLDTVELPADCVRRYAHELSGGQRQRLALARALATEPELLIADEPTSALDVSVQSQILNLLRDLKQRLGLTLVLISHDLAVVRQMADRVAVMQQGRIVELAGCEQLFTRPAHAYTRALLDAIPRLRGSPG